MKHIAKYRGLHESEGDHDQEIEDLKQLVDLGFAEPVELKTRISQKYGLPRREEFLAGLMGIFSQLGITPFDYTTSRQQKNGTFLFQLAPAQVEKILFEYPLPQGLTSAQTSRMGRLMREMEPLRDKLRAKSEIQMWDNPYGGESRSSQFQYFVYPRDIRGASYDRHSNSSGFVKFDGQLPADSILARFIYQLALDAHPWAVRQH